MEDEPVPVIAPDGVSALQPGYAGYHIRIGGFQHQEGVIAHEAIGMDLATDLLTDLGQGFGKSCQPTSSRKMSLWGELPRILLDPSAALDVNYP
jgi:hypothetical protein